MRALALLLACLLCVCFGRSLQKSDEEMQALETLLLALHPKAQSSYAKVGIRQARSSDILMEDAAGAPTLFSQEEKDALYAASTSKEKACSEDFAKNTLKSPLLNLFGRPQNLYALLRNPNADPPDEIWDVIREKWPILKERSNAELLKALGPIKAKYVDIRSL
mmetsp:Transcript_68101/g.108048  ORF Transcript_68101/g.108048 Transcript_68101/m.108048 type:complete len:164 (-) Transcript_68101:106-597(-)